MAARHQAGRPRSARRRRASARGGTRREAQSMRVSGRARSGSRRGVSGARFVSHSPVPDCLAGLLTPSGTK
jgi:hypothetical protein